MPNKIRAINGSLQTYWNGSAGVRPQAGGLTDATTTLDGPWPDTHLQWTFRWAARPGLILRRRVRLYDELGRPAPLEYAAIHLMEDLETGAVPPSSEACDGILDI